MRRPMMCCLAVLSVLLGACESGSGAASSGRDVSTGAPTGPTTSAAHAAPAAPASTASTARSTARSATPAAPVALIDHVHWTRTARGRQLQVFPTRAGRTDTASGAQKLAWAQVLADAPHAGTAGMYDQFLCHWNYARVVEPDKPSWNLEPWRRAVGYRATVAALCNPGGSEG